jgi:Predicted nucleoside-diphosphate-sugar epimerases
MKKITITGSLGHIGSNLTRGLVARGVDVTVVTSKADRVADIEALGAKAAVALINDARALADAFAGADAVFAMTPPNLGGANIIANTTNAGKSIAEAITKANVKRVVMLSSIGAEQTEGTGPIVGLHNIEAIYSQLSDVNVTFLRAGDFYTNFYNDVPMVQHANILGGNYPADVKIPFVHPRDIAIAAAEELLADKTGNDVRYIVSDVRTPGDYVKVLGNAIGKPELPWVEFTDEQSFGGMTQAGLTEEMANIYTEMGAGIRAHKLMADFEKQGSPVTGTTKFEDFAKEWAAAF